MSLKTAETTLDQFFVRIILMPFNLRKELADGGAIYICTYTYMHASMHTYIYAYIHTCTHTYIHTHIQMFVPWQFCIYVTIFSSKMQVLSAKNIKLHWPNLP